MTAQAAARPAGPLTASASRPLVYLAGRYSRREELRGYAEAMIGLGTFRCEARWLTGEHEWDGSHSTGEELAVGQRFALEDLEDLGRAHAVVVFTEEPGAGGRNRGGRHVELGLAIAWQKHVIVVGPPENVFTTLPFVKRYSDWAQALQHLIVWKDAMERAALRARLAVP